MRNFFLTLQELINHIRTEEANCLKDKMEDLSLNSSKANLVESSGTVAKVRFKGKQKKVLKENKKKNQFNKPKSLIQKSKGPYFVRGKLGHRIPVTTCSVAIEKTPHCRLRELLKYTIKLFWGAMTKDFEIGNFARADVIPL